MINNTSSIQTLRKPYLTLDTYTSATTAPQDDRFVQAGPANAGTGATPHTAVPLPRIVLAPGLEFDPARKYRYGMHALGAAVLIFVSFILIELRDCNWGPGINLDQLQALHISMAVFAFVLYVISLFGIADFVFKYKLFFLLGVLTIYVFAGLMIWMTYEAAVNPCVKTFAAPIDFSLGNKNVFSRGDGVGIVVLLLDIFATLLTISAATNFYKRY